ncbi:MAG: M48 family metalloprotease [Rickettsiales bacterium]|jgi:predicted Zn-dependent protease|nr:M48 family metalloprotease [Rickettsiales bacterium]
MKKILFIFLILLTPLSSFGATREIRDTEIESVMSDLIRPIEKAAKMPRGRLRIHILSGSDFNAFVTSGEDVYVYAGLIMNLENPNAVQAVVAHEMGHIVGGHYAGMMARIKTEIVGAIIMQTLGAAVMVANPEAGMGVMAGAAGVTKQNLMSFSRDEERLADATGMKFMKDAGLPLGGFIDMMEIMQGRTQYLESRINTNDISHPTTTERLMHAKEWVAKNGGRDGALDADLTRRYLMARAKLAGYLMPERAVRDMYASGKSDPAKYAFAISALRGNKLNDSLKLAKELSDANKKNPYFYELIGDIESQRGNYSDAIKAYEKSLATLGADSPQISGSMALAMVERAGKNDARDAVKILKKALVSGGGEYPFLYFVLARAYAAVQENGLSDWAMAEYYWANDKKKDAKKFAERAKKKLDANSPEYKKTEDILRKND